MIENAQQNPVRSMILSLSFTFPLKFSTLCVFFLFTFYFRLWESSRLFESPKLFSCSSAVPVCAWFSCLAFSSLSISLIEASSLSST